MADSDHHQKCYNGMAAILNSEFLMEFLLYNSYICLILFYIISTYIYIYIYILLLYYFYLVITFYLYILFIHL